MNNTGNTHNAFPAEDFTIVAFCDACEHRAALDRAKVPAGVTVQELRGRLRCLSMTAHIEPRADRGNGATAGSG
jgi:hypothetical protein